MTQQTGKEKYIVKEYKSTKPFIKACGKVLSEVIGGYPEDELSTEYYGDKISIEQSLIKEGKFCYSDYGISIDINKYSHIYVYCRD